MYVGCAASFTHVLAAAAAGIDLLKGFANVDTSYNLTPEELQAKVSLVDALIVRSATKVRWPHCTP